MTSKGWIGIDLDGTLARYDGWQGPTHIGDPVPSMVDRVKDMLRDGVDVRIFTARVACVDQWVADQTGDYPLVKAAIDAWCKQHIGRTLPVTNRKDYGMVTLYDDRCEQVVPNTGLTVLEDIALRNLQALKTEITLPIPDDKISGAKAALQVTLDRIECPMNYDKIDEIVRVVLATAVNMPDTDEKRPYRTFTCWLEANDSVQSTYIERSQRCELELAEQFVGDRVFDERFEFKPGEIVRVCVQEEGGRVRKVDVFMEHEPLYTGEYADVCVD